MYTVLNTCTLFTILYTKHVHCSQYVHTVQCTIHDTCTLFTILYTTRVHCSQYVYTVLHTVHDTCTLFTIRAYCSQYVHTVHHTIYRRHIYTVHNMCTKSKSLYLSVNVFSTAVLMEDTVNSETNILNQTETC